MTTSYCTECGSTDDLDLGRGAESLCCDAPIEGGNFRGNDTPKFAKPDAWFFVQADA